jgi:ABC-type antimicrobial peptide transport system ATPase subunit
MGDAKFLKCYGVKSGLIVYFCINIEGNLIPYARTKMKKRERGVKLITVESSTILSNLTSPIDPELLILQFTQIRKSIDTITTKNEAIKWFLEKRKGVIDIGHLMKIENALMHLTTYG